MSGNQVDIMELSTVSDIKDSTFTELCVKEGICQLWSYTDDSKSDHMHHMEEKHYGDLSAICKTCNQLFSTGEISQHVARCKGSYVCHHCRSTFANKAYLLRHIKRKHSLNPPSRCDECGRLFSSNAALNVHKRTHTGIMPYECSVCETRFIQQHQLMVHLDAAHGNSELKGLVKKFACDVCEKRFFSGTSLRHHVAQVHIKPHKDRKFVCEICDKRFVFRCELKRHSASHISKSEYSHKCSQCAKTFNQHRLLLAHMLVHDNADILRCPYCQKVFSSRSYLQTHMNNHFKYLKKMGQGKQKSENSGSDVETDDYCIDFETCDELFMNVS